MRSVCGIRQHRCWGVGLDPMSPAGLLLFFMGLFLHPASLQDHSPVASSWGIPDRPLGKCFCHPFRERKWKLDL